MTMIRTAPSTRAHPYAARARELVRACLAAAAGTPPSVIRLAVCGVDFEAERRPAGHWLLRAA